MTAPPWEQGVSRLDGDPIICVTYVPLCFQPHDVEVKEKTADLDKEVWRRDGLLAGGLYKGHKQKEKGQNAPKPEKKEAWEKSITSAEMSFSELKCSLWISCWNHWYTEFSQYLANCWSPVEKNGFRYHLFLPKFFKDNVVVQLDVQTPSDMGII